MLKKLAVARYRFNCRAIQTIQLPDYAGSMLRGAFGHGIYQQCCLFKKRDCKDCSLSTACPYPAIFKPLTDVRKRGSFNGIQTAPVPYLIEPPDCGAKKLHPGDTFSFNMVLIGQTIKQLPLIVRSWQVALERGLTSSQGRAELLDVQWLDQTGQACKVYQRNEQHNEQRGDMPEITEHQPCLQLPSGGNCQDVHIELLTPLCIQQRKKTLRADDISAAVLLRNIIRRVSLLQQFHKHAPEPASRAQITELNELADQVQDQRRLSWRESERYSSRQQQKMKLGGLIGHWLLYQVPPPLYDYLYQGQWLHVGKETVFGLGQYRINNTVWQIDCQERST